MFSQEVLQMTLIYLWDSEKNCIILSLSEVVNWLEIAPRKWIIIKTKTRCALFSIFTGKNKNSICHELYKL